MSIKKVDGLYTMTYYGNYNWLMERVNDYIYSHSVKFDIGGCTLFTAFGNEKHPIYCRNEDWSDSPILLTKCNPSDGYSSIALSIMNYSGIKKDKSPTLPSLKKRYMFLISPYSVYDGMNKMGVTIAGASLDLEEVKLEKNKKKVTFGYLARKILDHSKNVGEAIAIIKKYNVADADGCIKGHIFIGDSSGRSIIAECYNGYMKIIPNAEKWQVVTNTPVYPYYMKSKISEVECSRYQAAYKALKAVNGIITWKKGMDVLKDASTPYTQWSTVYDMKNGDIFLAIYKNYNKIFKFNVKSKVLRYTITSNKS